MYRFHSLVTTRAKPEYAYHGTIIAYHKVVALEFCKILYKSNSKPGITFIKDEL